MLICYAAGKITISTHVPTFSHSNCIWLRDYSIPTCDTRSNDVLTRGAAQHMSSVGYPTVSDVIIASDRKCCQCRMLVVCYHFYAGIILVIYHVEGWQLGLVFMSLIKNLVLVAF